MAATIVAAVRFPVACPAHRFLAHDADALYAKFLAAGGVGPEPGGGLWAAPADTPWGTRACHVRDPGGNVPAIPAAVRRRARAA